MRTRADAIMVGAGTVRDDDPDLTCRLPGLGARSPVRIVLGSSLDPASRLARSARGTPVWLCGATALEGVARRELESEGVLIIVATLRFDVKYAEETAVVKAINVKVGA